MPRTSLSGTRTEIAALLTGITIDSGDFTVRVTDHIPRPGTTDRRAGIVLSASAKTPTEFQFVVQAYVDSGVGADQAQADLDTITDAVDTGIGSGTGVGLFPAWEIGYDGELEVFVAAATVQAGREDF